MLADTGSACKLNCMGIERHRNGGDISANLRRRVNVVKEVRPSWNQTQGMKERVRKPTLRFVRQILIMTCVRARVISSQAKHYGMFQNASPELWH